jgi:hypothetical protein
MAETSSRQLRVLFIGNSYTQRNDLPGLIAGLAAVGDPPRELLSERVIVNGASLRRHWNAGAAELIRARPWDVVVLQEQSTLPVKNARRYHENVRLFAGVVREHGARLVLYLAWARQNAPDTQTVLNQAAEEIAREVNAAIAPVGLAWQHARAQPDAPELFEPDGSHPTLAGSYLAACVFYGTLFGGNPAGLPAPEPLRISDEQLRLLQSAAGKALGL